MSQKKMNDDMCAFEAALASLTPAASSVDRDQIMYLAGQAAGRAVARSPLAPARWFWPCATAASLLVAVTVAVIAISRGPQIVEKIVHVPAKKTTSVTPATATPKETVPEKPRLAKDPTAKDPTALPTSVAPEVSPKPPSSVAPKVFAKRTNRTAPRKKNPGEYLQLRRMVLAGGVDALPKLKQRTAPTTKRPVPKWAPQRRTNLEGSLGS